MLRSLDARALVDTHTHTSFSDGGSSFDQNARAARAVGCMVLVSTDHLTLPASMDPTGEVQVVEANLAAHRAAFDACAADYPELEMVYGFECDWYEGCEDNIARWSAGAQMRLGSVHWLGSQQEGAWIDDPDDMTIWRELGPDEVWRRYAATWCQACSSGLFDSMAHPDLAQRFSCAGFAPTIDLAPLWDEMVACARDTGMRVELSTASLRKGLKDYYPAQGLLKRFLRAGVPLTVGSDAHVARDICWGISEAYDHAARIGYRTVEIPRTDGSWQQLPIA